MTKENDPKKLARLIEYYTGYSEKVITSAAKDKAKRYGESLIYILEVWESKAVTGGFSLERDSQ